MFGFLKGLVQIVIPIVTTIAMPQATIATVAMGIVKHKTKIPNKAIPAINLIGNMGIAFGRRIMTGEDFMSSLLPAVVESGLIAGMSTGLHQAIKVPMKMRTGRSW